MQPNKPGTVDLFLLASFIVLPFLAWQLAALIPALVLLIFALWIVEQPGDTWDNALVALTLLLIVTSACAVKVLVISFFLASFTVGLMAAGLYCLVAVIIILKPGSH